MPDATATAIQRRNVTEANQNARVLALADELLADPTIDVVETAAAVTSDRDPARAVFAEALRCATSRHRLLTSGRRVHLSVVFATDDACVCPAVHAHGEDVIREKVRQLDWLCRGLDATWDLTAIDDGWPLRPSSTQAMLEVIRSEGLENVRVVRLADAIDARHDISPAFAHLDGPVDSQVGGSVLWGMWDAANRRPPPRTEHVVVHTTGDLSTNLAQAGVVASLVLDGSGAVVGPRYGASGAATVLGFHAVSARMLQVVLPRMRAFDQCFELELLLQVARVAGTEAIACAPIVWTEGAVHVSTGPRRPRGLGMVRELAELYDTYLLVHDVGNTSGEELTDVCRRLGLGGYADLLVELRPVAAGVAR